MSCASYKWHLKEKPLLSPDACFSLSDSDYKEDRGVGAGDGGMSLFTVEHMATITVWGAKTGLLNILRSVLSLPFFFVILLLDSSFLISSQADIDVIHRLALSQFSKPILA